MTGFTICQYAKPICPGGEGKKGLAPPGAASGIWKQLPPEWEEGCGNHMEIGGGPAAEDGQSLATSLLRDSALRWSGLRIATGVSPWAHVLFVFLPRWSSHFSGSQNT